eukprot:jgi/Mesvir1/1265/Mv26551-RA.1
MRRLARRWKGHFKYDMLSILHHQYANYQPFLRGGYKRKQEDTNDYLRSCGLFNDDKVDAMKKPKVDIENFKSDFTKEISRIKWECEKRNYVSHLSFVSFTMSESNLTSTVTPGTKEFEHLKNKFCGVKAASKQMGCNHQLDVPSKTCKVCNKKAHYLFTANGHSIDNDVVCSECVLDTLREAGTKSVSCPICEGKDSKHDLCFPFFRYDSAESCYAAVMNQLAAPRAL